MFLFLFNPELVGQADSLFTAPEPENIGNADVKAKRLLIDMANPDEVEMALKKIHTFKYLESLVLEGESDESAIRKLFYRLSVLKNLTALTLRENALTKVPDNIRGLKALQSLSVEDNVGLDFNDLFLHLKAVQLRQLSLIDNDLKVAPAAISEISSLKKVQLSGSNQLDYAGFVEHLSRLPNLTVLSIAVNYITELPKNIDRLRALQVLDVSNNNLTELPDEISSLKAINNLSIQGNLLIDPAADLEKLKDNNIQYLSLDKEISGEELEKIRKMFPAAQIDFPISKEDKEAGEARLLAEKKAEEPPVRNGELKVRKEAVILSAAYQLYPILFQGIVYNYDTLNFEERYHDLRYQNVYQRVNRVAEPFVTLHFRKYLMFFEKAGKRNETWFRFSADQNTSLNFPELRAFGGMYWVYKGPLTKKQFKKAYLENRKEVVEIGWFGQTKKRKRRRAIRWNDIRVDFDKNNSLFKIEVKTDTGFAAFTAYPVVTGIPIERSQQTYYRRYQMYDRVLTRRRQRFKGGQATSRARYDLNFKRMKDYAWKELQLRMSDDEKVMTEEDWLSYFDMVIADEQKALDNSGLVWTFISKALLLRGYISGNPAAAVPVPVPPPAAADSYAFRTINADFVDAKSGGKLAVANIVVLDNKNKTLARINGTLGLFPNPVRLRQFSSYSILVELRNGSWGAVSPEEIDKCTLEPNKVFQLNTRVMDKNLDTIGDLLKSGTR